MVDQKTQSGLFYVLVTFFQQINYRRRCQFLLMIGLTLISAVAEVVSLGAVVPFIGILTQPETVFSYPAMAKVVSLLGISTPKELILPLTLGFAAAALIAGGVRLLLLWVGIKLANATGADLSINVFERTLYQPYSVHVSRSSSEIISGITQKVGVATSVLVSLVLATTSLVIFVAILLMLLLIDPVVALTAMGSFGLLYVMIGWLAKRRLQENSGHEATEQTRVVKILQEGLGAIRDVLIDGVQSLYTDEYAKSIRNLQRANGENKFINQAPRYAMEAMGLVLIAILAYVMSERDGGIGGALPVLGALALGAQRLLPLLQQMYGNWAVVMGSRRALLDVIDLLDQPLPEFVGTKPVMFDFKKSVSFKHVSFQYNNEGPLVLDNISLDISKGSRIGFVGTTGSGKSTVLDLMMLLLKPTSGEVLVDGKVISGSLERSWQLNVAHVPQSIFLVDGSIAENIAFGIEKDSIDLERVKKAAEKAQISTFIEGAPCGYDAFVGERGVRLSGGQRQRIGIARALYKNASVLIFDEATSALDNETEQSVMEAIESLDENLTVLIVAHRLSTLQQCDKIIRLERGEIAEE